MMLVSNVDALVPFVPTDEYRLSAWFSSILSNPFAIRSGIRSVNESVGVATLTIALFTIIKHNANIIIKLRFIYDPEDLYIIYIPIKNIRTTYKTDHTPACMFVTLFSCYT